MHGFQIVVTQNMKSPQDATVSMMAVRKDRGLQI
jgi:hypothetical protein